jgi:hexokinase
MDKVKEFLREQRLRAADIDMEKLVGTFTDEMIKGLEGRESSLRMIPTYIEAENDFLKEVPVLAIDAGGTNFRAALIRFSRSGKIEYGEIVNYRMPGLENEVSSAEFFRTIADYIRSLAEKTERIGFCFSYPTEILPSKDGRLLQFCKEVQAPEVVGQLIGKPA